MIYIKQNNIEKWRVRDYTFNDPQMGVRTISLTVNHPVDWVDGDPAEKADFTDAYVEYDGERYDIVNPKPTAEKDISGLSYKYTLAFEGAEAELKKRKVRNLAETGVDNFVSQGTTFSIYADINQFVQLLNNNLKYYFGNKWTINIGVTSSDEVNITISNMFLWDLLLKTYEYYGVRFFIRGNTINIGQDPDYIDHIFDYGAEGGLVKITRIAQEEPLINRLIGTGGSRNVPVNYFTNRYSKFPSDPNPISGDVNIKNIMPKSFRDSVKTGILPYKDYVEDASLVALNGVHEDSLEPNEDIYPSIAGVEVPNLGRIDQIIAAESVSTGAPDDEDYKSTFDIWVKDIGFDLKDDIYTSTEQAKISFTSGLLTGYEFTILAQGGKRAVEVDTSKSHNGVSSKYKITLIKSDEELDASGMMLPYNSINAVAGDSFVIYDIEMPQSYVELAEQRVEDWLNLMLDDVKVEKPTYSIEPMDMFFEDDAPESDGKTIKQKLKSGNKLSINNTKITDGIQELFINSVNIQYGGLLPKYTFTVTDKVQVQGSAVNRLQSAIDAIMIRQNLTQLEINSILKDVSRKYLSKLSPDTASELITFLKGIIAGGTSEFAEMIVSGKITAKDIDVTDNLKTSILQVLVSATIQDAILKGQFNSETFTSGFLGEGFRLSKINDRWTLELDDLIIRKTMQVYELIVQRIRYQGGQVIHSPAGGKITKVTNGGTYWRIEHDSPDDFITNDQVQCQNFKVGSAAQNPDGSTTFEGVSVKRYWRLVTSYGRGWFNLSKTDMEAGSAEPEVGDDIVVLGNRTDPTRQNAYMIVSTGANSPYTAHLSGINSYSTAGKEKVREGNLSGIVDPDFGQLSGYGLYGQNVFLRGRFSIRSGSTTVLVPADKGSWSAGTYYYYDRVSHNGSLWLCVAQPSTTSEPTDGSPAWEKQVDKGTDGKGISDTQVRYQVGSSGTTVPTGTWLTSVPSLSAGRFLWTRTITTYTDSTSTTSYSVSKYGETGATGKGISSTVITYQAGASGTTIPTGTWTSSIPSVAENQYLWTRTVITYTDSTTSTSYSVGKMGAKGDPGISVTLTDVEYAVNTNPTTPPATGWTTTAPALTEGQQLWTRTKTTYSSGNPTYSTPANITPKTGAIGQGIESIVEEFYLSIAKDMQSGGSWSTTPPSWEYGKYIWTRSKITYKNPTSIEYTTPVVSSEWEAVNELKIGDVNLARYSGAGYYLNSAGVLSGIYSNDRSKSSVVTEGGVSAVRVLNGGTLRINQVTGLTNGKTYTWRIMIKGTTDLTGLFQHYAGSGYGSTNVTITEDWAVYTNTFVCQGTYEILHIYSLSDTFYIADWMLVEGNRVTEGWSPCDLDVKAEITRVETETKARFNVNETNIQANVSAITTVSNSVTGLTTRVSAAESSITAQATQIQAKVSQTEYNANNASISNQFSLFNQRAGNIELSVSDILVDNVNYYTLQKLKADKYDSPGGDHWRVRFTLPPNTQYAIQTTIPRPSGTTMDCWAGIEAQGVFSESSAVNGVSSDTPRILTTDSTGNLIVSFRKTHYDSILAGAYKITLTKEYLPAKLLATGINIENQLITLTANKTIFKSNSGATIAVFNASGTKIVADAISLEGLTTINSNFKVLLDGSIEAVNGKFTGQITAVSGVVGGFAISPYDLEATSGSYPNIDSMLLSAGLLRFTGRYSSVYIGADTFPSSGGGQILGTQRIAIDRNIAGTSYGNVGMYIDIKGSTSYDTEGYLHTGNHAIYCIEGDYAGFRLRTRRIGTSGTLSDLDNVVLLTNTSDITITLPYSPKEGQIYIISSLNSGNYTIRVGNTSTQVIMRRPSVSATSYSISADSDRIWFYIWDKHNNLWRTGRTDGW